MPLPKDDDFQPCQIKRYITGHTGEDGNWVPGGEYTVANAEVDIQPKGGRERATALQTDYESDYAGFIYAEDIEFQEKPGSGELFEKIKKGDTLVINEDEKYNIVFPGDWKTHYELDLKEN